MTDDGTPDFDGFEADDLTGGHDDQALPVDDLTGEDGWPSWTDEVTDDDGTVDDLDDVFDGAGDDDWGPVGDLDGLPEEAEDLFDETPFPESDVATDSSGVVPDAILEQLFGVPIDPAAVDQLGVEVIPGDLDPISAAAVLDAAGVDAEVRHGDIDDLHDFLANHQDVVVTVNGELAYVTGINEDAGVVELGLAGGETVTVPLEEFAVAWEDSAGAMVVTDAGGADAGPMPVRNGQVVLPVSLAR